jgi:predicted peptidase
VLHGLGGNEDTFLGRDGGQVQKLAEQHGFIVAAPLGYRINGGYGSTNRRFADPSRKLTGELSEKDVLNVLKLVTDEYGVDPQRTYLMGHSMGGGGTWYLGQKYAEKWAALAPIAGGGADAENYPFDRLKGMPVMVSLGDADATAPVGASRAMVSQMKSRGMSPIYMEVPGATHGSIVQIAMPKIFDFLAPHSKK